MNLISISALVLIFLVPVARYAQLGDETMDNWRYWMGSRFLAYKGVQEWWGHGKQAYTLEFQGWIDSIIETSDNGSDIYRL